MFESVNLNKVISTLSKLSDPLTPLASISSNLLHESLQYLPRPIASAMIWTSIFVIIYILIKNNEWQRFLKPFPLLKLKFYLPINKIIHLFALFLLLMRLIDFHYCWLWPKFTQLLT